MQFFEMHRFRKNLMISIVSELLSKQISYFYKFEYVPSQQSEVIVSIIEDKYNKKKRKIVKNPKKFHK